MDKSLVAGKIVLCDGLSDGLGAMDAGAAGTVMPNDEYPDLSFIFPLPTACLDAQNSSYVHDYVNSTRYFYITNSYSTINL